eukprot:12054954-Ditylum_brightwellii.AAC.1
MEDGQQHHGIPKCMILTNVLNIFNEDTSKISPPINLLQRPPQSLSTTSKEEEQDHVDKEEEEMEPGNNTPTTATHNKQAAGTQGMAHNPSPAMAQYKYSPMAILLYTTQTPPAQPAQVTRQASSPAVPMIGLSPPLTAVPMPTVTLMAVPVSPPPPPPPPVASADPMTQ